MCQICVEIIRERITIKEAMPGFQEAVRSGDKAAMEHAAAIIGAAVANETKAKDLIKAGYKKERWI